MKLLNFTSPELMLARLQVDSKESLLKTLAHHLEKESKIADAAQLLTELQAREGVESTGIGGGIAIPHTRSIAVRESLLLIAGLQHPIAFDAVDNQPVDLIFLLIGSRELPGQQLKVLARISKLVRVESFLDRLRDADTPAEMMEALREAEVPHF